ncbi:hypothetical protein LCGC14_2518790 [marine sediment metagenome]|uniref:Uncharacterized protein n=1 Tax=marine sediment metagenome TaxID=412755 RepID=A0A0F9DQB5_9ZZZZ
MTNAAATRRTNRERDQRRERVHEAVTDEHTRFNKALGNGAMVYMDTFAGRYRVTGARGFDITSVPVYQDGREGGDQRTWMLANDSRWAQLLKEAGVERNPLFA